MTVTDPPLDYCEPCRDGEHEHCVELVHAGRCYCACPCDGATVPSTTPQGALDPA